MKMKQVKALFRVLVGIAIAALLVALRFAVHESDHSLTVITICGLLSFALLGAAAAVKINFCKCPHCHAGVNDPDALYCPNCGKKIGDG